MEPAFINARPGVPRPLALEELRSAVDAARSWRGVMRELGFTGSRTGRALRAVCDEHAIDYSHFRQARADVKGLAELVAASSSWTELLTSLGYAADSGSARATVRKHCRRRGIDLSKLGVDVPSPTPEPRLTPDPAFLRHAAPYLVAAALTLAGAAVSLAPEVVAYDLLADVPGSGLRRLQVKTVTAFKNGTWQCRLTRSEYSATSWGGHRRAHYSREEIDDFACVTADTDIYLVPITAVEGLHSVSLRRMGQYRLPRPQDHFASLG